jgi:ubiquinol-cytochrome c reductase cytochrome b subunit
VAAVVIGLSVIGSRSEPGVSRTGAPAKIEVAAEAPAAPPSSEGEKLIKTLGCLGCHMIEGEGGKVGPDLSMEGLRGRTQEWLAEQIRNPKSHNPASVMPAFSALEDGQVDTLVRYLQGLKSDSASQARAAGTAGEVETATEEREVKQAMTSAQEFIGNPGHGAKLFRQHCEACHGAQGKGGVANPGSEDGKVPGLNPIEEELADRDPARFVAKIDPYIQNGETPPGPQPALKMPDFGRSMTLTQAQISHLEAHILSLNGVRRDEISRPGLRPASFFILSVALFGLGILVLAGIRLRRSRR